MRLAESQSGLKRGKGSLPPPPPNNLLPSFHAIGLTKAGDHLDLALAGAVKAGTHRGQDAHHGQVGVALDRVEGLHTWHHFQPRPVQPHLQADTGRHQPRKLNVSPSAAGHKGTEPAAADV